MRAFSSLLLATLTLPVFAGNVYKWTDASGQVHYSQTPPADNAAAAKAVRDLQPGVSIAAPAKPAPAPAPAAKAAPAESAEAKNKRCAAAKERVAYLEERTARRLFVTEKDGTESRMTEEEFDSRLAKAHEAGKGC